MTELKTLKDITFRVHIYPKNMCKSARNGYIDAEEVEKTLHAEAIKWIKALNRNRSSNGEYSKEELTGIVRWTEYFFNITEEDLK